MRYYLDTEFVERGHEHPIELVSLALVREDYDHRHDHGDNLRRHLSLTMSDGWSEDHFSDWHRENLLPYLPPPEQRVSRADALRQVVDLFMDDPNVKKGGRVEIVGYYSAYDWTLLCQLFGRMVDLPKFMPYYCIDIMSLAWSFGYMPDVGGGVGHLWCDKSLPKHDVLSDAINHKRMFDGLMEWRRQQIASAIDNVTKVVWSHNV